MEKTFQAAQLTHERFLTLDHFYSIFLISAKLKCHKVIKKCKKVSIFYVGKSPNLSKKFIEEYKVRITFFVKDIF